MAGTLLRYPRYVSRVTGTFTTPEVIVEQLRDARQREGPLSSLRATWAARQLRKAINLAKVMLDAP